MQLQLVGLTAALGHLQQGLAQLTLSILEDGGPTSPLTPRLVLDSTRVGKKIKKEVNYLI